MHAHTADKEGNLRYSKTARNFNPVMASAAKTTIVEAENIVEPGEIDPDCIHTPGIYVKRVVQVPRLKIRSGNRLGVTGKMEKTKLTGIPREMIALRISKEIKDGDYVNLGIGIPTLISNWIEGRISCCRVKSAC